MNVIWLNAERATRVETDENLARRKSAAISQALLYLKEDADEMGESYLSYLVGLAAFDASSPPNEHAAFHDESGQDDADRLDGMAKYLEELEAEARGVGEKSMSGVIRWARDAAVKRAEGA